MSKKLVVKVNGNPYEVEIGDLSKSPVDVSVDGKSYKVEFEKMPPSSGTCQKG